MENTYTVRWEVDFEIDAKNRKAAIECVRRKMNRLYATTNLSLHELIECLEWSKETKPENAVVLRDNHLAKPLRRFSDACKKGGRK